MKIMALDIGDSRIGVALSDSLALTAQPHSTIKRGSSNNSKTFSELGQIIESNSVETIVAGLPLEMSGKRGEQALKTEKFIEAFQAWLAEKDLSFSFEYVDERLSSVEAERTLQSKKLKNRERRAAIDRIAASIILQTYLDQKAVGLSFSEKLTGKE